PARLREHLLVEVLHAFERVELRERDARLLRAGAALWLQVVVLDLRDERGVVHAFLPRGGRRSYAAGSRERKGRRGRERPRPRRRPPLRGRAPPSSWARRRRPARGPCCSGTR